MRLYVHDWQKWLVLHYWICTVYWRKDHVLSIEVGPLRQFGAQGTATVEGHRHG
jgi:hypothetical protein